MSRVLVLAAAFALALLCDLAWRGAPETPMVTEPPARVYQGEVAAGRDASGLTASGTWSTGSTLPPIACTQPYGGAGSTSAAGTVICTQSGNIIWTVQD